MSRTGSIRKFDTRRYMWERKRIIEWHDKKPPKYRFISYWFWWKKRPFKWIMKEWEDDNG